jgi:GNAT superfamily N-acetyltransferase
MGAQVRSAGPSDIAEVRSIALATWPVAYREILSPAQLAYMLDLMYSEKALLAQMRDQGHRFLLAHDRGMPAGFASFSCTCAGATTRIHKLYVLPHMQGLGIGLHLLEAIKDAAAVAGDGRMELNVNRHNPSVGFYHRNGFAVLRDEVIDIGHGHVMDDHVMELHLT